MKKNHLFLILMVWVISFSCKKDTNTLENSRHSIDTSGTTSIMGIIKNSFSLSILNAAIQYTGLQDSLMTSTPYTVFAPDDGAFQAYGVKTPSDILKLNKDSLSHLLKYHFLKNRSLKKLDIPQKPGNSYQNSDNSYLYVSRPYQIDPSSVSLGDFLSVNGVILKQNDVIATNGIIHILPQVLKYPKYSNRGYLEADTSFSLFMMLIKQFKLDSALDKTTFQTVFAPKNPYFRMMGISEKTIQLYDPLHYKSLLITPNFLLNLRFYTTDLFDFLPDSSVALNQLLYLNKDRTFYTRVFSVDFNSKNLGRFLISSYGFDIPSSQIYNFKNQQSFTSDFSGISVISNANNTTTNGVIQEIENILVDPSYVKLTP